MKKKMRKPKTKRETQVQNQTCLSAGPIGGGTGSCYDHHGPFLTHEQPQRQGLSRMRRTLSRSIEATRSTNQSAWGVSGGEKKTTETYPQHLPEVKGVDEGKTTNRPRTHAAMQLGQAIRHSDSELVPPPPRGSPTAPLPPRQIDDWKPEPRMSRAGGLDPRRRTTQETREEKGLKSERQGWLSPQSARVSCLHVGSWQEITAVGG
ncbi:hypothetical protein B0T22DRAFT_161687 [Podospora appendiculata]|uniref:Uncharacterized protein n=1 Tax=Podospora appendiculata TaxID=314037 RepID=A0AAE1CCV9_9PEZI|nr:hypothetical protein B0T22DRAFT_161687 [Podospora appendiculata]